MKSWTCATVDPVLLSAEKVIIPAHGWPSGFM
jgi:hypothetical protein